MQTTPNFNVSNDGENCPQEIASKTNVRTGNVIITHLNGNVPSSRFSMLCKSIVEIFPLFAGLVVFRRIWRRFWLIFTTLKYNLPNGVCLLVDGMK